MGNAVHYEIERQKECPMVAIGTPAGRRAIGYYFFFFYYFWYNFQKYMEAKYVLTQCFSLVF